MVIVEARAICQEECGRILRDRDRHPAAVADYSLPVPVPDQAIRSRCELISMFHISSRYQGRADSVRFGSSPRLGTPMSDEEMKAELDRLRSENAALKKGASSGVRMKVSEKGAVSVYGMGRFPVTLYKEQWLKLLDLAPEIRKFIAANEAQLKTKD
jgi:hypothetical protein